MSKKPKNWQENRELNRKKWLSERYFKLDILPHFHGDISHIVMGISSGTYASLTGLSEYVEIDIVRDNFLAFTTRTNLDYETWVEAWNHFEQFLDSLDPKI